ncbi:MAG: hypothetical protein KAQ89_05425 [Planctomycetes bacterium]|nr:hypothetical protein [Planctomycetota bacterium]
MANQENNRLLEEIIASIELTGDKKKDFQKTIDRMYEVDIPIFSFNHFPWQSRKIVKKIFDVAMSQQEFLYMFLGNPKGEFYDENEFFESFDRLASNTSGKIVLAEKPSGDLLSKWRKIDSYDSLDIYFKSEYNEMLHHLCMAGSAYRLESPHSKSLKGRSEFTETYPERPAQFGFHNPNVRLGLKYYWDSIVFKNCAPLKKLAS